MFFEAPIIGRGNARRPEQIVLSQAAEGEVLAPAEQRFGEDVKAILETAYPSHYWYVGVDFKQGVAWIHIPILMGPTAKYYLHLDKITDPTRLKKAVLEAGGHILERFRIPRGSLDLGLAEFLDARANKRLVTSTQAMPE